MTPPPKYPREHRQALVDYAIDAGNVKAAVRAAAAGQLQDTPAFQVPYATAAQWVQLAKIDRYESAAKHDPVASAVHWGQEVAAILETQGNELLKAARKGQAAPQDIIAHAKARREVAALVKSMGKHATQERVEERIKEARAPVDLAHLIADAAQHAATQATPHVEARATVPASSSASTHTPAPAPSHG